MPHPSGPVLLTLGVWFALSPCARATLASPTPPDAATVARVIFEGGEPLSRDRLERLAALHPGDPWTEASAARALRGLLADPFVERVAAPRVESRPDGRVEVTLAVSTRPLVLAVRLEGHDALSRQTLLEGVLTAAGGPLDRRVLREDRDAIEAACHADGFLFAQVDAEVDGVGPGRVEVIFRVSEGRRVSIERVELLREPGGEDGPLVPKAELLQAAGLLSERLFGVLEKGYYRPAELAAGLENARRLLRSRGWLDAEIGLEAIELDERRRSLEITLRVDDGVRYRLEEIVIEGHRLFPTALLHERMDLETGDYWDGPAFDRATRRLERWYEDASDRIPRIRRTLRYRGDRGVVAIVRIDESEHRFVGRVEIVGNELTRDRVIRQRAALEPGAPLTTLALEETESRLRTLGIFGDVSVGSRARPEDPTIHDVRIEVDESSRWLEWELGGGASSGEGEIAYFRAAHPNFDLFRLPRSWTDWRGAFTGGGQSLGVEVVPGTRESQYTLEFREPWLLSSDRALRARLGTTAFDYGSYDEDRLRALIEVRQFLDELHRLSAALEYRLENVRISDFDASTPDTVLRDRGWTLLSYPHLSLAWNDVAQNPYSGPRGVEAEASLDFADSALGSEADFARARGSVDWYLTLFDRDPELRHVLHLGLEAGWAGGHDGDHVPFFESLYAGGPRSFRGFRFRGVGPHEQRTAVGGGALVTGTVEYSAPLFFREVRGVALFDWGAVEDTFGDLRSDRIRTAAGAGLQLRFPLLGQVVPVNLYWVEALSSMEGDRERVFTFTLGFGF